MPKTITIPTLDDFHKAVSDTTRRLHNKAEDASCYQPESRLKALGYYSTGALMALCAKHEKPQE